MHVRRLAILALLGLALAPLTAQAADGDNAPSLVVRLRSIDGLLEDGKYVVSLLGKEEEAKQFDGFVRSLMGKNGLEGIDTKKPLGIYGTVGPNGFDSTGVLLLPIADEAVFLKFLDRMNVTAKKDDTGLYTAEIPKSPATVFFRFANNYVYATVEANGVGDKKAVAKGKLIDPAEIFPANLSAALSVTIRFDQIPNDIKQMILGQLALRVKDAKDKKLPDETAIQQAFRASVLEDLSKRMAAVLKDGSALTFKVNLDRKANDMVVDLSLTAKSQTKLASDIAELGQSKSLFAGTLGADSAINMLVNVGLPAELRKALDPVIEEGMKLALEKEKDDVKRAQAEKFLKAMTPTLKSGEIDGAFSLRGPNKEGKYALVLGARIKDGNDVEKAFRAIVKELKQEEQDKIKFDAAKVGSIGIIELDVKKDQNQSTRALFGENSIYMAFRNDAWFLAAGDGGLDVLKSALTSKPKEGPQFQFEASIKRLQPALERDNKEVAKFIEAAFGKGADNDKIRFSVEGGKALRMRFSVRTEVVKFFADMGRKEKAAE